MPREIEIGGILFVVKGKKLVRKSDGNVLSPMQFTTFISTDPYCFEKDVNQDVLKTPKVPPKRKAEIKTPKKLELNGVSYVRTKSGNLVLEDATHRHHNATSKQWTRYNYKFNVNAILDTD